jgi:hypothetical protein
MRHRKNVGYSDNIWFFKKTYKHKDAQCCSIFCLLISFNPLKPSSFCVPLALWHCQNSAQWPQRFFPVLYESQNKLIIYLNNLSWMVFVMEIKGVFCETETLFLTFGRQNSCFKVSGNDLYILWPVCLHMKNKVICNLKMKNRRCWNGSVMFSFLHIQILAEFPSCFEPIHKLGN